jgi:hypothetical protein
LRTYARLLKLFRIDIEATRPGLFAVPLIEDVRGKRAIKNNNISHLKAPLMAGPINTTASERDVKSPITQSCDSMDHLRIEKTRAVRLAITLHSVPPGRIDEFQPLDRVVFAF